MAQKSIQIIIKKVKKATKLFKRKLSHNYSFENFPKILFELNNWKILRKC